MTEVTTEHMVNKIYDTVLADRWVRVRDIAHIVHISIERMQYILHQKLDIRKLSAK